jgi:hypothetical protein
VDFRLARRIRLERYRRGELSRNEVCDGQPELMRNAEAASTPTSEPCPVCEEQNLVHVTYVFGPRMPKSGRCVTSRRELRELGARPGSFDGYVVEVCPRCRWNHLDRRFPVEGSTG